MLQSLVVKTIQLLDQTSGLDELPQAQQALLGGPRRTSNRITLTRLLILFELVATPLHSSLVNTRWKGDVGLGR